MSYTVVNTVSFYCCGFVSLINLLSHVCIALFPNSPLSYAPASFCKSFFSNFGYNYIIFDHIINVIM